MTSDKGKVDQKVDSSKTTKAEIAEGEIVFEFFKGLSFRSGKYKLDIASSSKVDEKAKKRVHDPTSPPIAFHELSFKQVDVQGKPKILVGPALDIYKIAKQYVDAVENNSHGIKVELNKTIDWRRERQQEEEYIS